jgi:hypothetical protein
MLKNVSKTAGESGPCAVASVLSLAFAAVSLAACTSPEPDKDAIVRKAQEVSAIQVHSLPPGCFVELNNEFMGVTPLTIRVPSYEGDWSGGFGKYHILRASIPRARGHDQKFWRTGDPVPKRVVFRIPGAERWYHANSPKPPAPPTGVTLGP